jgi:hypothetical protein
MFARDRVVLASRLCQAIHADKRDGRMDWLALLYFYDCCDRELSLLDLKYFQFMMTLPADRVRCPPLGRQICIFESDLANALAGCFGLQSYDPSSSDA